MEVGLTIRQLHARGPLCRGLAVDLEGVVLGANCVLVRRCGRGYRLVDFGETGQFLKLALGGHHDVQNLELQLDGIQRALTDGYLAKAQILGLQTHLAGISGEELARLEASVALLKYDPAEPRDNIGRWTAGAGGSAASKENEALQPPEPAFLQSPTAEPVFFKPPPSAPIIAPPPVAPVVQDLAPETVALLSRLLVVLGASVTLGGLLALIPTNGTNIHEGDIPGRSDLTYRLDEGELMIDRVDDQGNLHRVYEGFPDGAGLYRDSAGRVIGQHVGTGAVFNLDSLPLFGGPLETPSASPDTGLESFASQAEDSDDPKNCPPPTVEIDNGSRSTRATAYQSQITGLLPGFDVLYNGVRFDGCNEVTQRMKEAKGLGTEWLFERYPSDPLGVRYYNQIMKQAEAQNRAGAGRGVDWHFADPHQAAFFDLEFKLHHYDNITVYYTEAIVKKIEEYILWIKGLLKIGSDCFAPDQHAESSYQWAMK